MFSVRGKRACYGSIVCPAYGPFRGPKSTRLALQKPPRSMAAIHRQVTTVALEQGWEPPSYGRVHHIIKGLDPTLVIMAHQRGTNDELSQNRSFVIEKK